MVRVGFVARRFMARRWASQIPVRARKALLDLP